MDDAVAESQEQPFPFIVHVITERTAGYPIDCVIATRHASLDTPSVAPHTPGRFMGQDWKTLGVVVIGAALAGWLVVRMLAGGPAPPTAPAETERAMTSAPRATAADVAVNEAAATPASRPAPGKPAVDEEAAAADGDESGAIVRDLTTLAQALQRDVRIEDRVMPRVNDGLDVPGPMEYRRAPDFWEPALAGGAERTR